MSRPAKLSPSDAPAKAAAPSPVRRSWTAMLAATTLGVAVPSVVHASIQSDARLESGRPYRLVVQSYDKADGLGSDPESRPTASFQRAVTAEELRHGVSVGLLEFRHGRRTADGLRSRVSARPVVLAWVEEGKPDLELDGLRARPRPGSLYGTAPRRRAEDHVQISVRVKTAAA